MSLVVDKNTLPCTKVWHVNFLCSMQTDLHTRLREALTDVHDFPQPGIVFKDITGLFLHPQLCTDLVNALADQWRAHDIEAVVGLESRGFLFGFPLAMALGVPFVLVRKKGKLPRATFSTSYQLEYGEACIEMHTDALKPGQRVLVHDDVLASGGTASAAAELVHRAGAHVVGFSFLLEIDVLKGREKLAAICPTIHTFAAS
jgi:adenine phosphoribosyltransferase